jgi:hypothetical protein
LRLQRRVFGKKDYFDFFFNDNLYILFFVLARMLLRGVCALFFLGMLSFSFVSGVWWHPDAFSSVRFSPQEAKALFLDFGVTSTSKVGGAAVGGASDLWNAAGMVGNADVTQQSLLYTDGSLSSASVRLVRLDGFWGFTPANGDSMYGTYVYPADLGAQDSSVIIAGLLPGTYDVYVYGHVGFPGYGSSVTLSAGGRSDVALAVALTGAPWEQTGWVEGSNYVKGSVTLGAGEDVRLLVHPTGGNPPVLGGLQLVPQALPLVVPVPVTSTSTYSCSDSDGGLTYELQGTLTVGQTITFSDGRVASADPLYLTDSCSGTVLTEYSCSPMQRHTSSTFTCPGGCSGGACVSGVTPPICPADVIACSDGTFVSRDPTLNCQFPLTGCLAPPPVACGSCSYQSTCLPFGFRFTNESGSKLYCAVTKQVLVQKVPSALGPAMCDNNYECTSNVCSAGECVEVQRLLQETSVFRRAVIQLLCRLSNLFDASGYDACISEYLTGNPSSGAGS